MRLSARRNSTIICVSVARYKHWFPPYFPSGRLAPAPLSRLLASTRLTCFCYDILTQIDVLRLSDCLISNHFPERLSFCHLPALQPIDIALGVRTLIQSIELALYGFILGMC